MEWLLLLILLIPVLIIGGYYYKKKNRVVEEEVEEPEKEYVVDGKLTTDVPDDAFVFVKYRGVVLSMRVWEKRDYWDKYNRVQRNEHLEGIKKSVKKGRVTLEWLDSETCCYVPVDRGLQKVKEEYNKFKELGGVLEEEK